MHQRLVRGVLCIGFIGVVGFLFFSIGKFYNVQEVDFSNLQAETVNGNGYQHFTKYDQIENGNYVWIYVCDKELEAEWKKRSNLLYNGLDSKNQKLRTTIIRYLSSKGYRKDSVGLSRCTSQDVKNMESGLANYIFENRYSIYPLIYKSIWEIDVYLKGNNPAGNSITQRLEFLKAAKGIISKNFYLGVGTGDVQDSFNKEYEITKSKLPGNKRFRAHNQYVTFLLTFGVFGFSALFFSMFYPIFVKGGFKNYLFVVFFTIALLSFINEDTLETQAGVTFFSYFYSLFLFGSNLIFNKQENYV